MADFARYYPTFTWEEWLRRGVTRVAALARHLPPEAAINRVGLDDQAWSRETQALTLVIDLLRVLAWQNTEDGVKGRNTPKPLPRPGDQAREEAQVVKTLDRARRWQEKHGG